MEDIATEWAIEPKAIELADMISTYVYNHDINGDTLRRSLHILRERGYLNSVDEKQEVKKPRKPSTKKPKVPGKEKIEVKDYTVGQSCIMQPDVKLWGKNEDVLHSIDTSKPKWKSMTDMQLSGECDS